MMADVWLTCFTISTTHVLNECSYSCYTRTVKTVQLSREQVESFLRLLHPIPVSKGLTHAWVIEHAPEWKTDELMGALRYADAVKPGDSLSGFVVNGDGPFDLVRIS